MRIYTKAKFIFGEGRDKRECPRAGFYNIDSAAGGEALDMGAVYAATEDNRVVAYADGATTATLIDVGAGETLDGYSASPAPPEPEHELPVLDFEPDGEPDEEREEG